MSARKSIALLVCDTPIPEVLEKYGNYHQLFTALLTASLPGETDLTSFKLDPYDVVNKMEYPSEEALDSYDGVMMTGSAASAYEDKEWINRLVTFVKNLAETRPKIKIIGICFGHQIVARALGGECVPNNGRWELGPTPIQLTQLGKEVFGVDTLNIQQFHRDHVPTVPPSFRLLASTDVSHVQGLVRFSEPTTEKTKSLEDVHIFTVQGHPEFTEPVISTVVKKRAGLGIIDAQTAEGYNKIKDRKNDGVVFGRAIWKVLGVAPA